MAIAKYIVGGSGSVPLFARPATVSVERISSIAGSVFAHFNAEFSTVRPTVPIAWDGVPFNPETDVPSGASWVRVSLLPGDRRRVSTGPSPRRRRVGLVSVQVFAPLGDGLLAASAIADDVEAVFDGATIAGIRLGAPRTERVGPSGAWYQLNVFVAFQRDDDQ